MGNVEFMVHNNSIHWSTVVIAVAFSFIIVGGPLWLVFRKRNEMPQDRTMRRWRNMLTLLIVGPVVSLLYYVVFWAIEGMHPLDRWFYLVLFLAVGIVASAIAATVYLAYWFVDSCARRQI
jgi:hypothetical protein